MTTTDTYLLLRAFCDELARCGVEHACTSPGSRNTPVLLSLVRQPAIRCWSHIDERSAAFFALGAAKASGRPAVLACTSGTAAANYVPAVVEAFHARVPLIVLTADRPPELREVGAGQAIDQVKLYGDAVKWYFEIALDDASPDRVRWIRQLACRVCWTTLTGRPGPVHLNIPLREPLLLEDSLPEDPVPGRPDGRPWTGFCPPPRAAGALALHALPERGVIVAGRSERDDGVALAAAQFARAAGYPLLADPLSGARGAPTAMATYDLLIRDEAFRATVRPDLVVRIGDLPTSKPLRAWLGSLPDVEQVSLDPEAAWQDPAGVLSAVDAGDPALTLRAWTPDAPREEDWVARWRAADNAATAAIDEELGETLSEPLVARLLGDLLGPAATLLVASSMPIRDIELYLRVGRALPRVVSNRGANGIDGTVSTAFGMAAAGAPEVTLLIGDVALAHDLGGLLAARRLGLRVTIIVLNNDGGGIFHFLAVSGERDAFEEHVATPHGLDFVHAAALYDLEYHQPKTADEFVAALRSGPVGGRSRLIEVRTDRVENRALHGRVAEAALRAINPTARGASPQA